MPAKKIVVGQSMPIFSLPGTNGQFDAKSVIGKKCVIYFYPKDNTPGCTQEGVDFNALLPQFKKARVVIVGVSADTLAAHEKFKTKLQFGFDLLSDEDKAVCKLFDVMREKNLYGRKFIGIERSTFLFDAKGVLRREWRKVKVKGHAEEVLAAAREL